MPPDTGLCLVVNNLRAHVASFEKSRWLTIYNDSEFRKTLFAAPEFQNLLKFKEDIEKHLGIPWPTLRDEVLGDAVVFAYRPGLSGKAEEEQGVLLIHVRQPEVLTKFLDNLNQLQKASGDLKSLESRDHLGAKYLCRIEPKVSHFYVLQGSFFAYTGNESLLKDILEKRQRDNRALPPIALHLNKVSADKSLLSLWLNPRAFDAELKQKANGSPEGILLHAFLKYWSAFDAIIVSCSAQDNLEVKLTILAREQDLPASARPFFMEPARPAELWQRFPDDAILSIAGAVEGSALADAFGDLAPPEVRKTFQKTVQPLIALAGIDLATDIAPNIGPAWGMCVLPGTAANALPQAIAAIGIRPGTKDVGVDQAIYRGAYFLAGLALFEYNRQHADNPIAMRTLRQGPVEVKYLANDKLLPPGFQPACALKDGYLLLATSPDAIARFGTTTATPAPGPEVPFLRLSAVELAKTLRQYRQPLIDHIAANDRVPNTVAARDFDNFLAILDLLARVEVTRASGAGQSSFVLRVVPRAEK